MVPHLPSTLSRHIPSLLGAPVPPYTLQKGSPDTGQSPDSPYIDESLVPANADYMAISYPPSSLRVIPRGPSHTFRHRNVFTGIHEPRPIRPHIYVNP